MFTYYVDKIRLYLIEKLIGQRYKVVSNVTITSDIIQYNKGFNLMCNAKVKKVSDSQSFVYNPNTVTYVN